MISSKFLLDSTLVGKKNLRKDNLVYQITKDFEENVNSETIYKNLNPLDTYNVWIYDDSSERSDFEKKFIEMKPNDEINQGDYIHFNGYDWLVRGVDKQFEYKQRGLMFRCLDYNLQWVDEDGLHALPFFSQSKVLRDPLLDNGKVVLIDDSSELFIQKNTETMKLRENYRFLFGTRTAFKIIEFVDYYIDGTIKLILKKDEVGVGDDFTTGIAYNEDYSYKIEQPIGSTLEGDIGSSVKLDTSFFFSGKEISHTSIWSSSDESKISVDQLGNVSFNSYGTAVITAEYNGLTYSLDLECKALAESTFYYFTPDDDFIIPINGDKTITVSKYINGIEEILDSTITCSNQDNTFVFEIVSQNTFKITNNAQFNKEITISVVDNDSLATVDKVYKLKAW